MARIERTNEKYSRATIKRLHDLAKLPLDPDAPLDPDEFMDWLNDEGKFSKADKR